VCTYKDAIETIEMREFYVILGIGENASVGEVRKAYRKLARKYHPDINPGNRVAADRFDRISEAYEVLRDVDKRGFYDQHGYFNEGVLDNKREPRLGFSFQSFDASGPDAPAFADLFDDFFAEVRSRQLPEISNDIEAQVSLTFEESIRGFQTSVSVFRRRICESCRGQGRAVGSPEYGCPACRGAGELIRSKGHLRFAMTCPECEGSGRVAPACPSCRGEGQSVGSERFPVDIPAGVSSGSRIRYAGRGNTDPETGKSGDLLVVTNVAEDPFFRRVGDNVYCTVSVSVTQAALGTRIDVPSLHGAVSLKVPPGTQGGQSLRLRGHGAPSLRGDGIRGDQYVEIQVLVPHIADERSREILRELELLNPVDPQGGVAGGS
jgi:molecular chaperone DnaJ